MGRDLFSRSGVFFWEGGDSNLPLVKYFVFQLVAGAEVVGVFAQGRETSCSGTSILVPVVSTLDAGFSTHQDTEPSVLVTV